MKNSVLISAVFLICETALAQDVLVTSDSTRLKTRVLEIQQDAIRFKLLDNEGPTYVINKSTVAYIVYQNGTLERFKAKTDESSSDKYNLDGSAPVKEYRRIPKERKDNAHLYKGRNYIGFNHLALLNSNISFSYMRDLPDEKMILHIPFSIGTGKPDLTNGVYNGPYLATGSTTTYNIMRYQIGAGLLFSPSFGDKVNFMIGPSFNFAQYDMSTKTIYNTGSYYAPVANEEFKNDFILYRQMYGGTLGFLFRITQRLNMTMMASIGMKKDAYNEKDPFGIDYVNSKTQYQRQANTNVLPYANFSWTLGYRF